ncbi:RagB/SusD family nutrient uptake outer membrane protein [Hyunsoonleella sp. SJ7]|uniref:RagB/SusD family nutrient uptake outer membrane protein n=1 Tax=Hyunsoonleella aquatilis TaxID=2762758 RepID=A0A923H991_9FLAO|nr:RagB/SusD family nutrient uptake outer membrane protein [Hyunsoonleella aquatilis]MBC3759601.1 RagB/SusD family nutrient uptake outer membrane protein [Hyunsoonleella aquatilis]
MKTYKILFLLVGLSILGCSDLEEDPVGVLAPEGFFQSTRDIQTAVNSTYGHMAHEDFWGRKMSLTIMLRSDMVDIGDPTTSSRRIEHNDFNVPDDNGMISGYWNRLYQIIAAANNAIAGAEQVDAAEGIKNPITAQAYFVRAFIYFHLVRQFGDIPYIDAPVTDVDAASSISKTSVADVYTNIIADLEFAKTWLPNTQSARSIPAKSAAHSYLALVYLTMGEYQKAYDEAKGVIDNEATYGLALEPDFQELFNSATIDGSKEPIFALDFNGFTDGDDGRDYQPPLTGLRNDEQYAPDIVGGGWSVAVPSLEVFNTWDDQDYRKWVSFDDTAVFKFTDPVTEEVTFEERPYTVFKESGSSGRGVNRPHIAKYTRMTGPTATGNGRGSNHNYSMMRYAEVLLIAAEALNEVNGGSAEAHGYVNRVRERARNGALGSMPSSFPADVAGLSQDEFRTMVLDERRLELAFEFKRWYDIARRKMGSQVFSASGLEGEKPNFDPNQDYLLPLPADELARNSNLLPQNPGY